MPGSSKAPQNERRSTESEFRNALVAGDIAGARALTASLAGDAPGKLRALHTLIDGVEQIARRDDCEAAERSLRWCSEVQNDLSVRWLSWLWRAAAGVKSGKLDLGKSAADTALAMVGPLGDHSRASTLAVRAAIDFLRGDVGAAGHRVVEAGGLFQRQHPDLHAALWLAWGRIMLSLGQARAGLRALNQAAQTVDAAWASAPLAREALLAKRTDEAADLLLPFVKGERSAGGAGAMVSLVEDASRGRTPVEVVSEYAWLSARPITGAVADQLEAFVEEQAESPGLRELYAWDLIQAGHFARARVHLEKLAGSDDGQRALSARGALDTLGARERERRVGLLDVIQAATWTKAARDREVLANTEAELFWVRWTIGNGDLGQADADLAGLGDDDSPERILVTAIQTGHVPLEVAREYLWIRERPVTDGMLDVMRGFFDDHAALGHLRLLYARDLLADGFSEAAREQLEALASDEAATEVSAAARRELEALGERRDVSQALMTASVNTRDFVMDALPWPSVLDRHSLLFHGPVSDLHPVAYSGAEKRRVAQGQELAAQGDPGELLYLVCSGEIRASRTRKGLVR